MPIQGQGRPYPTLPPRAAAVVAEGYIDQLPDALNGVLRQFATAALSLLEQRVPEGEMRAVRRAIFDHRDRLTQQLVDWMELCGVFDHRGALRPAVRAALLEETRGAWNEAQSSG